MTNNIPNTYKLQMKRALLIGINYENDQDAELRGCINDIQNIKSILIETFDFDEKHIQVLTDETEQKPTRSNIERNIFELVSECKPGDKLFFYYSGHGSWFSDYSGDESDGRDEMIIPIDYKYRGIITDDWLHKNLIKNIPNGVDLLGFMDCCNSGTLFDLKYNFKSKHEYIGSEKLDEKQDIKYKEEEWSDKIDINFEKSDNTEGTICMFSGCQDPQYSMDAFIKNKFQGAFSYCLTEYIKENTYTEDGKKYMREESKNIFKILKAINCKLNLYGFVQQTCQLSIGNLYNMDVKLSI